MRGDGAVEDVDGYCPPQDGRVVGDDDDDDGDSPSEREVSPAKQLRQSPRLVPPRFRLVAAESHPEKIVLIFFSSKYSI